MSCSELLTITWGRLLVTPFKQLESQQKAVLRVQRRTKNSFLLSVAASSASAPHLPSLNYCMWQPQLLAVVAVKNNSDHPPHLWCPWLLPLLTWPFVPRWLKYEELTRWEVLVRASLHWSAVRSWRYLRTDNARWSLVFSHFRFFCRLITFCSSNTINIAISLICPFVGRKYFIITDYWICCTK